MLVTLVAIVGADLPDAIAALRDPQHVVDTRGADELVLYLLQLVLIGLCLWCVLCVVLLAAGSLRGSGHLARWSDRLTPRWGRHVLGAALGIGTLTLAACGTPASQSAGVPSTPPAYAASSDAFDWGIAPPSSAGSDAPTYSAPVEPEVAGASMPPLSSGQQHLVAAGDCLWDIAAAHLGPAATPAEIAYHVDEIYLANQSTIGNDPDELPIGAILAIDVTDTATAAP